VKTNQKQNRRIALKTAVVVLFLAGALCAKRIETLVPELGGRVVRDSAGNWIVAQGVSKPDFTDRNVRLRKLTDDSTAFDITIGGSGNDDLSALANYTRQRHHFAGDHRFPRFSGIAERAVG
jgi:hypothetical protein